MEKNKKNTRQHPLPKNFTSLKAFSDFWDRHSTADYENEMEEVDFQINLHSRRDYYPLSRQLSRKIRSLARKKGIKPSLLISRWLKEKVLHATRK